MLCLNFDAELLIVILAAELQKAMAKRIVAFGEIVWDLLPHDQVLGGTPLNLVFRCNSFGEEGHLLSRVGDDELGEAALDKLIELKISDKDVQVDSEFPTGVVRVTFDKNGESRYEVKEDVAFDHIEFTAEALILARQADCLFLAFCLSDTAFPKIPFAN